MIKYKSFVGYLVGIRPVQLPIDSLARRQAADKPPDLSWYRYAYVWTAALRSIVDAPKTLM